MYRRFADVLGIESWILLVPVWNKFDEVSSTGVWV